jgi:carbon storage regulator
MLVLSRKPNQSIVISADIIVTVIEIKGDQVRLGIKAPRSVTVHREEVAAEIVKANQAAAAMGASLPPLPRPTPRPPT